MGNRKCLVSVLWYWKKICEGVCLFVVLLGVLVVSVGAEGNEKQEGDVISCVALGDSIAKGYAGSGEDDLKCYSELLGEKVSEETGLDSKCVKYAKNGLDLVKLNSVILSEEEVLLDVEEADLILMTVGANDLLLEFKRTAQEVLGTERRFLSAYDAMDALMEGVGENPLLIMKLLDVLNAWDYEAFEEQWTKAAEVIARHRKESSQMIVTNIYNPVSGFELPGNMNEIVEEIILNMNDIMYQHAEEYDYCVVDLFSSDICEYLQEDGLHPTQAGQELIAGLAFEKTDTGRFIGEPEKEMKEEVRPKRAERRKIGLWNLIGPVPFATAGGVLLVVVYVLYRGMRRKRKG